MFHLQLKVFDSFGFNKLFFSLGPIWM